MFEKCGSRRTEPGATYPGAFKYMIPTHPPSNLKWDILIYVFLPFASVFIVSGKNGKEISTRVICGFPNTKTYPVS